MDVIPSTSKGWLFLVGAVVVGAIIDVVDCNCRLDSAGRFGRLAAGWGTHLA
jgi:hypothetical protein